MIDILFTIIRENIKRTSLFLVFFLLLGLAFGQRFVIEPFVGDISFPSNELHGIVEDDIGNKWVASDAGLIKITGNKVKIFTKKDGLATNVILKIYKDQQKRIWMAGPDGSLSVIDKGHILPVPANSTIRLMDSASTGLNAMYSDIDGYLYAAFDRGLGMFKLSPDLQHAEKITMPEQINRGQPLFTFFDAAAQQKKQLTALLARLIFKRFNSLQEEDKGLNSTLLLVRNFYKGSNNTVYVAMDHQMFCFKNGELTVSYTLPGLVYDFMEVNDKLMIAVAGQGLFVLDKNGPMPEKELLYKKTVTDFLKDSEGNLWITTLESGLFVIRNTAIEVVYNNDAYITDIILKNGRPLLFADKKLTDLHGTIISGLPPFPPAIFDIAFYREKNKDVAYYLSSEGLLRYAAGKKNLISKGYYAAHLAILGGRKVFWGSHFICVCNDNGKAIVKSFSEKIMCIAQQSDSFLLAGTFASGILRIRIADSVSVQPLTTTGRVNCIQKISENIFAIGTNEDGVQLINDRGKLLMKYKKIPNRIQALTKENKLLFAGTKEGLFIIDLEKNTIKGFNKSNGLPSNEIARILVNNDTAYLSGVNIAVAVPVKDLQEFRSIPHITLESITVNNRQFTVDGLATLSYKQNNLSFNINNYSYRASSNIIYHYVVKEHEKMIIADSAANSSINFSLEPGNYMVNIYAEDMLLNIRSNMISFPVNIATPFYNRIWFILLAGIIFILITALIASAVIKKVKARELRKRELIIKLGELEARALQGQMNPHFIFNAVNSVQDFILSNRNEEAHHYLSAFAKLIRLVLENNRKKNVTIEEEMGLLKLYVALEEQRMKEQLHLDIVIAASIEQDNVLLPSMLLQPIVENAIWHGLNGQEGEKRISIAFDTDNIYLTISISDNGSGLKLPDASHEPLGLELVKERIRLSYQQEPAFEYFLISNNEDKGVLVKIILPLQTAY